MHAPISPPDRPRPISRHARAVAALGLGGAAAPATPDPGTIVSFTWRTTGSTTADANATCLAPPPNECAVYGYCTAPTPLFSLGGSSMTFAYQQSVSAATNCFRACNCCLFGGGNGQGHAGSTYTIYDPVTSAASTRWFFSDELNVLAVASGGVNPGCVSYSGSGDTQATYLFDLTFDTSGTTRLIFARQNSVNVMASAGGSGYSTIILARSGGSSLFSETLSFVSGGQNSDGTLELALPEGRYTLRVEGQAQSSAAAPTGPSGGAVQARFSCTVLLYPYDCPQVTDDPDSATRSPGGSVTFNVTPTGSSLYYQWRRNGIALSNGPTAAGSTIYGATTSQLSITNLRPADAGSYDCVLTNLCGDVPSAAATLAICAADVDGNGLIQPADVAVFINTWSASLQNGTLAGDFDGNGRVEPVDVGVFINTWYAELVNGC